MDLHDLDLGEIGFRELRLRLGESITSLSNKSGVSRNTIQSIERGADRDRKPETIEALAEGFSMVDVEPIVIANAIRNTVEKSGDQIADSH